jgi:tRNA uridine 5-carbamoylmethylation protein Kti12
MERERDRARDQVEELTAVIKGLRAIMRQEAAKVSGHIGFYSCATVPAELCRRMERERDEARDIIRKAIMKFFEDDSDGRIAAGMLAILCKKEPVSQ